METRSRGKKCLGGVDYFESADLPHGVLPTKKAVVEVMPALSYSSKTCGTNLNGQEAMLPIC